MFGIEYQDVGDAEESGLRKVDTFAKALAIALELWNRNSTTHVRIYNADTHAILANFYAGDRKHR